MTADQMREAVARAMCCPDGCELIGCHARLYEREATAALTALGLHDGNVVVPVDPDGAMINEGTIAALEHRLENKHRSQYSTSNAGEVFAAYRAMLAARPGAEPTP